MRTTTFGSTMKVLRGGLSCAGYACLLLATDAVAGAPTIDTLFGTSGIARLGGASDGDLIGGLHALPSGRVVVVGNTGQGTKIFAARLLPDGQPDPAFGMAGRVLVDHSMRCPGF